MGTNRLPEMQCFETQRHRGHAEGKKEVEGRWAGEKYREGGVRIGFAGFGGRLSSGNSVDSVPLCFKKRGLKHRDTESTERGKKEVEGRWDRTESR